MEVVIPSVLEVGGVTYRVLWDNAASKAIRGNNRSGEHDTLACTLTIDAEDASSERIRQIFLHELLHAIDQEYCNFKALTEDSTDAIASGLLQVLKQLGVDLVLSK